MTSDLHPIRLAGSVAPRLATSTWRSDSAPVHRHPDDTDAATARELAPRTPGSFAHLLDRVMEERKQAPEQREAEVRRNVEELVAQTLIAPILEKLHEDPLRSGLFERTEGEKALRPLLEAEVAKDIAHSMRAGFIDHMAHRLLNPRGTTPPEGDIEPNAAQRRSWHA